MFRRRVTRWIQTFFAIHGPRMNNKFKFKFRTGAVRGEGGGGLKAERSGNLVS